MTSCTQISKALEQQLLEEEEGGRMTSCTQIFKALEQQLLEEEEEEEGSVWNALPCDLLLRILAFLPALKLLELLTVCKSWLALLRSPQMFVYLSHFAPRETWLVSQSTIHLKAFCLTTRKWCRSPPECHPKMMASAGGLIVCQSNLPMHLDVYNPLTNARKTFSAPSAPDGDEYNMFKDWYMIYAMISNPILGFYQVLLLSGEGLGYLTAHFMRVYDSRTQSWEWKVGHVNGHDALVYESESQSWVLKERHGYSCAARVVLDDDLFVLDTLNGALLSYNAERCMWSTVKTPLPSSCIPNAGGSFHLVCETVVKCQGRVLLVGGLASQQGELPEHPMFKALVVWEWKWVGQQGIGSWIELSRTSLAYFRKWHSNVSSPILVATLDCSLANDDNLICMVGLDDYYANCDWSIHAYDLDRRSWQMLELNGGPLPDFSYKPSWNAVP